MEKLRFISFNFPIYGESQHMYKMKYTKYSNYKKHLHKTFVLEMEKSTNFTDFLVFNLIKCNGSFKMS